jgi:hypothetical protein
MWVDLDPDEFQNQRTERYPRIIGRVLSPRPLESTKFRQVRFGLIVYEFFFENAKIELVV